MSAIFARILNGPALAWLNTNRALAAHWPEMLAGAIWLVAMLTLVGMPVSHDVIWQLWIARQMNAGVGLYTWIMEVNPPLWYWMAQPVELLASVLSLPSRPILVGAVFLLIGVSLGLTARLVADWRAPQRAAVLGGLLVAAIYVCLSDFAQREHLCLIGAVPYALLIARRAEGKAISWPLALGVGLLVTPMIALKHYFVLIPVLFEAWLLLHQRRQWRPLRVETLTLAFGAIGYGAAVFVFARAYLTELVPMLSLAYGDLRMALLPVLLNRMTVALMLAGFYFWHFRRELALASQAMLILVVAFTISYFLQFKGWAYHMDPVIASLLLALVLHLALRAATAARLRAIELVFALLILVVAIGPVAFEGPYRNPYANAADRLLSPAEPGMTAVMLTTKPTKIWPMAEDKGLVWPSRYLHFWMMQSVANSQAGIDVMEPALIDFVQQVRLQTVEDFLCNPPDIIIDDAVSIDFVDFNILAFFMQEPKFAALFAAYKPYVELGRFTGYRRVQDLPPPAAGTQCVAIAPRS